MNAHNEQQTPLDDLLSATEQEIREFSARSGASRFPSPQSLRGWARVIASARAAIAAQPAAAPGIDLRQFRPAVECMLDDAQRDINGDKEVWGKDYEPDPGIGSGAVRADCLRLLALIDASPKGDCHPDDAAVDAFARAYGYLWHVNHPEDIPLGHPYMSADRAASEARKELRDMLTSTQRGEGINWVRQKLLGMYQAGDAEVQPLCDLCRKRPEAHSDAEGIGFCEVCWDECIQASGGRSA